MRRGSIQIYGLPILALGVLGVAPGVALAQEPLVIVPYADYAVASPPSDPLGESADAELTPEEQEVVKKIEGKAGKAGFSVNIRLVASALAQERAEVILSELENGFI